MAKFLSLVLLILSGSNAAAFTLSMRSESKAAQFAEVGCRRSFLSTACATVVGGTFVLSQSQPSYAATAKEIITAPSGIKYAVTKETSDKKPVTPYKGEAIHRSNGILCPSTSSLSLFYFTPHSHVSPLRRLCCNRLHGISHQWASEYCREISFPGKMLMSMSHST